MNGHELNITLYSWKERRARYVRDSTYSYAADLPYLYKLRLLQLPLKTNEEHASARITSRQN